ncbi:hypothetical protein INS49_012978 [Diaporthe citri]|uniref:uncharacterized protein n=1 Tax=Diaporthe citri TaxID=83186 RepID=UPI001C7F0B3E|nr:uncharacterized protein INS49_012978 [Diaporthe citri]KAG6359457.1 hypothetical protein INS49_012978 [Diaporthe citri]
MDITLSTLCVKVFVDEVFEHIIGPPSSSSTTVAVLSTLVDSFFDEKEELLSSKLKELLRPFKEGYALPLDADFQQTMEKTAAERAATQAEGDSDSEQQKGITTFSHRRNDFGIENIIHTMQKFYDMALRTFTDNLINLAIESCLVQDLLGLFTPRLVNSMDDRKLAELAAEPEGVRNYRSQLREDIKLLK